MLKALGVLLVAVSFLFTAGPAVADEATDLCIAKAEVLRLATVGAESLGVKDEATLESKALDVQVKLSETKEPKLDDALFKAQEYQAKLVSLTELNAKGNTKIDEADYNTLSPLVAEVIECVNGLLAQ